MPGLLLKHVEDGAWLGSPPLQVAEGGACCSRSSPQVGKGGAWLGSGAGRPIAPLVRPPPSCDRRVDSMDDFKVEIDVQSFLTIVDGGRVYKRGKTWDFMVGHDLSVARIKEVVEEKFKWARDQRMTIWYGAGDNTILLISESEIAELFDRCSNTKLVRFGVTIENKRQHDEQAPVMNEEMDDQPVHASFFAWPKQAYEGEYEDDEPVGCDEENTYLHAENAESKENAEPQKKVEPKAARVPLGTLDVDNSYDPQYV